MKERRKPDCKRLKRKMDIEEGIKGGVGIDHIFKTLYSLKKKERGRERYRAVAVGETNFIHVTNHRILTGLRVKAAGRGLVNELGYLGVVYSYKVYWGINYVK